MTDKELAELDLAVAKEEGIAAYKWTHPTTKNLWVRMDENGAIYQPTRDGSEAMRLLEKYRLTVSYDDERACWECNFILRNESEFVNGPTPSIAICRAVVALKGAKP